MLRIDPASWAEWYSALEGACSCANYVGGGFLSAPDGRRYAVVANPWVEQEGWSIVAEGGGYGQISHMSTMDQAVPFSAGVLGNSVVPLLGSAVPYEYAISLGLDANGIPANPPLGPGAASGGNLLSGTVDLTSTPAYAVLSSQGVVFTDSVQSAPNRATRRAADALGLPRTGGGSTAAAGAGAAGLVANGIANTEQARANSYGVFYVTFEEHEDGRLRAVVGAHSVTNTGRTTYIVPSNAFLDPNNGDDLTNLVQQPPSGPGPTRGPGWAVYYGGEG